MNILHVLRRKVEGRGECQKITPTCCCGWDGKPHEAWEDLQLYMVKQQEDEHLRLVRNAAVTP